MFLRFLFCSLAVGLTVASEIFWYVFVVTVVLWVTADRFDLDFWLLVRLLVLLLVVLQQLLWLLLLL